MFAIKRWAAFTACLLLAACASVLGPREVELSQDRLQTALERKFPLHQRVLELFDLTLTRPQLELQPAFDRVLLRMDVAMLPRFGGQGWTGSMALSGRLELDPARHAVLLREARVERLALDRLDGERQTQLARVGSVLLDRVVKDITLYTFQPDELRRAGVQFTPTRIVTGPRAIAITLEPVR